jgi:hypothetical protein
MTAVQGKKNWEGERGLEEELDVSDPWDFL